VNRDHARRVLDFQRIKRVVPLTLVLEHYGVLANLRRSGAQLIGACPIHGGSNRRQFVVNPNTNEWKCFGDCARGGSTLEFVAAMENVSIIEAARLIASWFAIAPSNRPANHSSERRRTMSSGELPSHKVFVVEDPKEGDEDEKGWWTRCGSAWPHKDGKGLNVQLPTGLAVSGRLVLREYTDKDAEEDQKRNAKRKK